MFKNQKTQEINEVCISAIFNTMRILKRLNQGDAYLEAYQGHLQRSGKLFYDLYMLLWEIGVTYAPKRILEIGTRTGISLCQLLSAYLDTSKIEEIVCVDPFFDEFLSAALVKKNLDYLNLPSNKVTFIQAMSQDAFPGLIADGKKFDYILVDGDHTQTVARQDLESAHQLIDAGGIIVFDDISDAPGECALISVWRDFESAHPNDYEFNHNMSGKGVAWGVRK